MENMKLAALEYLKLGYSVIPLKPRSKIPMTAHGVKDATTDPAQVEAWWLQEPNANIAIACGNGTHVIDVDVDPEKQINGLETVMGLACRGLYLPDTVSQQTPRGGMHYFYKSDKKIGNKVKFKHGIDIRSDGGYVAVAPSIHPNGKAYQWVNDMAPGDIPLAEYPDFMLPEVAEPCKKIVYSIATPGDDIGKRAALYLSECDPAIQGAGGHGRLLWAASAMVNGFGLDDDQAFSLLSQFYNPFCQPPWELDTPSELKDFTRKITEARRNPPRDKPMNWLREDDDLFTAGEITPEMQAMVDGLIRNHQQKGAAVENKVEAIAVETEAIDDEIPSANQELSNEGLFLSQSSGLVGEICAWINLTSLRVQPLMALACAISFCGALFGRKVRDEYNSRTNIYCMSIGTSSSGKNHAPSLIRNLCAAVGCEKLMGGVDAASDSAMEKTISEKKAVFYFWDEIGHMLSSIKANPSGHRASIISLFMKLYSSANNTYTGKEYATQENRIINQPCCCLYGTATPERFSKGVDLMEVVDGWMGRCLIFMPEIEVPERKYFKGEHLPTESIVNQVSAWYNFTVQPEGDINLADLVKVSCDGEVKEADPLLITIKTTPKAEAHLRRFEQRSDVCKGHGAAMSCLWRKAGENARKIALILAVGDGSPIPQITLGNADFATRLVSYLLDSFEKNLLPRIGNSKIEQETNDVMAAIASSGASGITKGELYRKTKKIHRRERDAILSDLHESEEVFIELVQPTGAKKPTRRYWTADNFLKYLAYRAKVQQDEG